MMGYNNARSWPEIQVVFGEGENKETGSLANRGVRAARRRTCCGAVDRIREKLKDGPVLLEE